MSAIDDLLSKAKILNVEKKYAKAIDLLNDDAFDKINIPEIHEERAQSYWCLGYFRNCLIETEKALKLNPKSAKGNNYKANLFARSKEFDKAIYCYLTAIDTDAKYKYPYNGIANVYLSREEYDKAIEYYTIAIKIDNNFQYAINGLGNVYSKTDSYDEAIKSYEQAIALDKKDAYPLNGLGTVFLRLKKHKEAIEQFNKAIKTDSAYPASFFNRAITHQTQKDYRKALNDFKKYVSLMSDSSEFLTLLAGSRVRTLEKIIADPSYFGKLSQNVEDIKELLHYNEPCITHYTSLTVTSTLILNDSSRFRLSEGSFLNDTSEGRALFDFLPDMTNTFKKTNDTIAKQFVPKPFIGSFVREEKYDDLTLWRMYGKENKEEARGCAITLDRAKLLGDLKKTLIPLDLKGTPDNVNDEFNFFRVAYKKFGTEDNTFVIPGCSDETEEKLNVLMKNLFDLVTKYLERKLPGDVNDVYEVLNQISYLFKSSEYQYEHELRLVVNGSTFEKKIDNGFTPPRVYVELLNISSLIKKITLGPKIDCAEEWASGFYYKLNEKKLAPEILISHLPFK